MGNIKTVSSDEWLEEQFEFEYCEECGGDSEHHTAIGILGNWFARCDYPPSEVTNWEPHPVILEFKKSKGAR